MLILSRSVNKYGHHRQFLFLIAWVLKNLLLWNCFLGTLVSSNNKTDFHNITEILLKVVLNTITLTSAPCILILSFSSDSRVSWQPNDTASLKIGHKAFRYRSLHTKHHTTTINTRLVEYIESKIQIWALSYTFQHLFSPIRFQVQGKVPGDSMS